LVADVKQLMIAGDKTSLVTPAATGTELTIASGDTSALLSI
jgi:hypothetical protein